MDNELINTIVGYLPQSKYIIGGIGINTTLGVLIGRHYLQLRREFKHAKGVFSKGKYTSNFVITDRTSIEPIIDECTKKQRITNGKPDFLLKLSTTKDNVPTSQIFRGDFQRETMRFIERARQKAKPGGGTKPIFELMRQPGVVRKWDEIRLRTKKDRIIQSIEASWTRYCSERAHNFNSSARVPSVSVLVAEPDGRNNQIRIFDLPKWQLDSNNIPTSATSNIWVHNSLVDLFPDNPAFKHVAPDTPHPQRYRLDSLRSVAQSMMRDPEKLLTPNVVS